MEVHPLGGLQLTSQKTLKHQYFRSATSSSHLPPPSLPKAGAGRDDKEQEATLGTLQASKLTKCNI